jgi:DNA topoisomerase-3
MLKNPNPNQEVIDFYNLLKTNPDKQWYEYEEYKFVLIAEKPSQIKSLRAVLPKGKHIKIISLAGHIMRLKNFEEYDLSLKDKSWYKMVKDDNLPFIPNEFESVVKEKSTGKFRTDYNEMFLSLKRSTKEADFIISVADPDNEGCSLMYQPVDYAGNSQKILGQINMSKLDFFSLQEEIKTFDTIDYFSMAQAGIARSEFDWTFGLNNTILASVLLGGGQTYHIGGVKSPVLRMVYDRIKSIESFKPEKYCQFLGEAKHTKTGVDFKYIVKVKQNDTEIINTQDKIDILEMKINGMDKENPEILGEIGNLYVELGKLRWKLNELIKDYESSERDIYNRTIRTKIENVIKDGMKFKISNFETKKGLTQNPPLAYSLTDLQAEAGNSHNFTPAKTLEIAQKLYEGQWQSYPRTDNRYYATGEMANIKKIIPNLLGLTTFSNVKIPVPYKVNTGVFNSAKISAHTGLSPTTKEIKDSSLTGEMKTIYDMVSTRYLIQFMDKFEYYQVKLDVDVDVDIYITTHQNIEVKKGWRELYNPANMYGFNYVQKQTLPNMLIGDEIEILSITREDLQTKPSPMFNDFSLLKGMENIGRIYSELEGLEKGIGTPATRASILDQLFKAKYLIKKGKIVDLSPKAKMLIKLLPDEMTSPKLRADMEAKLNDIISNKITKLDYETEFKELISDQTKSLYEISKNNKIEVIDKATLPPSDAQIKFANQIAKELKLSIPKEALKLKDEMMQWLKKNEKNMPQLLSEKQYLFLKEYGSDDEKIVSILEAQDNRTMTKEQKFEASKWLGSFIRTSKYQKLRAAKGAATKKRNREEKMKSLGVVVPDVKLKSLKKK